MGCVGLGLEMMNVGEAMSIDEAMRRALVLADMAARAGDVPVGAVVLDAQGRLIGEGYNTREAEGDPLAHAEIIAMRQAAGQVAGQVGGRAAAQDGAQVGAQVAAQVGGTHTAAPSVPSVLPVPQSAAQPPSGRSWNLADCTLIVTLEPCPMCAGACVATHIGRIVFGAWDPKLGACGSVWDIPRDPHIGHSPEVFGGIRQEECAAALADFFAARRFANESN